MEVIIQAKIPEQIQSNPDNSNQNIPPTNIIGGLTAPIHSYPEIAFNGIRGNVYSYNGKL